METKLCPQCSKDLRRVNGGISKRTGKPYNAFWSCDKECGYTEPIKEPTNGSAILADEVLYGLKKILVGQKEINERLDKLIALVVQKLGK